MENTLTPGKKFRLQLAGYSVYTSTTYTQFIIETTRPPYGGKCIVTPNSGIVLETGFVFTCADWINPETETAAGLKYQVWSAVLGSKEPDGLISASMTPVTPELVFGLGLKEHNYTHAITVRISHHLGAFTEVALSIQVRPMQLAGKELSAFMETASKDIASMMSLGDVQKGRQVASAMASLLNTDDSSEEYDYDQTTPKPQTQSEGEKKKLRDSLVNAVSSAEVHTLDAIQQSASTMCSVTKKPNEVSAEAQMGTVGFISNMAGTLQQLSGGANGEPPSLKDTVNAAAGMLSSLGNAGLAARQSYQSSMQLAHELINATNITDYDYFDFNTSTDEPFLNDMTTESYDYYTTTRATITLSTDAIMTTAAVMIEENKEKMRGVTNGLMGASGTVAAALLSNQVPGQTPVMVKSEMFAMVAGRELAESMGNKTIQTDNGGFKFPSSGLMKNDSADFLDQKVLSNNDNPFLWDGSADKINSPVMSLTIGDGKGQDMKVEELEEDFVIDLKISPKNSPEPIFVSPFVRADRTWGTIHTVQVASNNSAIYVVIRSTDPFATYEVFLRYGERPTVIDYDDMYLLPRNLTEEEIGELDSDILEELENSIFVPTDFIQLFGTGDYHLLVRQHINISTELDYSAFMESTRNISTTTEPPEEIDYFGIDEYVYPWYIDPPNPYENVEVSNYTFQLVTPVCRFWNEDTESWETDGCKISSVSNTKFIRCMCNHLTSFGSDFFVPPNTIDFSSAYSNLGAKLKDNFGVLLTICILLGLYITVMIWARYMDKKDVEKWGVTPLEDNMDDEKYIYQISVSTGMRGNSGTESKISFALTGDKDETGVRKLWDGKRKAHTRGSEVQYVMTTERSLGSLTFLRIWHDNTGKGKMANWYLDRFIVTDLHTGKTYPFLVDRWLAVDEDDGQIDRVIPVAVHEDLVAFRNLFVNTTKKNLTDGHLWLSIFVRPSKSTYTRVQRLSVVVSVTFLTMIVNAMFYRSEPATSQKLELGFVTITTFQLYVSIMGTFIVMPPSILMDQIFRKARPRTNKTEDLIQKLRERSIQSAASRRGPPESTKDQKKKKKKKPITFPWWTVIFGWILVILAIGASSFFVFSYSMEWGKEKSNSWLTSMLLSIFQSVAVVQPVKVFVIAAILAIILKKPDVTDLDDEEKLLNACGETDEELDFRPNTGRREKVEAATIDKEKLEKIRQKRLNENEMLKLLKEMVVYVFYLMFLLFLTQQNRNSNAFYINQNIKNMLINYESGDNEKYMKPEDIISYLTNTFLPSVYWTELYNGDEVGFRDRPFMSDMFSFRIGAIRLRQLRIEPDRCKVLPIMRRVHNHCNSPYSVLGEDKGNYFPGWIDAGNVTQSSNSPWAYRSMMSLNGAPHVGLIETYNGGGFVVDLSGTYDKIQRIVKHLDKYSWFDKYTRVVFIELGVLNPFMNLFSRVNIVVEFTNSGLAFQSYQINTFQLYSYVGPQAVWIIFCEIMVLIFIIIFLVRIIKKMKSEKCPYWSSFWNVLEFAKVVLSIVAIAMYMMKNAYVTMSMGDITNREGEFMNFQRLAIWNETFIYLMSFVCFASILECLHLLRFNIRMSMLARTLKCCSGELSAFSFTFFIIFMSFVLFAYVAFSPTMEIYKGFITTIESMIGHLLGDIDLLYMMQVKGWFGVIFYIFFIMVMTFVVLNMFFTIMGEAFTLTREEIAKEKNRYELLDFVVGLVKDLAGMKQNKVDIDLNDDGEEKETDDTTSVVTMSTDDLSPGDNLEDIESGLNPRSPSNYEDEDVIYTSENNAGDNTNSNEKLNSKMPPVLQNRYDKIKSTAAKAAIEGRNQIHEVQEIIAKLNKIEIRFRRLMNET